jgi:hypothetical protein
MGNEKIIYSNQSAWARVTELAVFKHLFSHETKLCGNTALVIRHPGSDILIIEDKGTSTVEKLSKVLAPPRDQVVFDLKF